MILTPFSFLIFSSVSLDLERKETALYHIASASTGAGQEHIARRGACSAFREVVFLCFGRLQASDRILPIERVFYIELSVLYHRMDWNRYIPSTASLDGGRCLGCGRQHTLGGRCKQRKLSGPTKLVTRRPVCVSSTLLLSPGERSHLDLLCLRFFSSPAPLLAGPPRLCPAIVVVAWSARSRAVLQPPTMSTAITYLHNLRKTELVALAEKSGLPEYVVLVLFLPAGPCFASFTD